LKIFNPQKMKPRPSCVLLDLDHTLYDYPSCNAAGMEAARTLAYRKLNLAPANFDRHFDAARKTLKKRLGPVAASHSRLLYFQLAIEAAGFRSQPAIVLRLEQAFWRAYLDKAVLFDNVKEFLDDLRIAGVPALILTDLTAAIQLRKIVYLGLDAYVDWIVTSEESGRDKADPVGFNLAIEKVALRGDGPVWMVGDNLVCDLHGARTVLNAVTLLKSDGGVPDLGEGEKPDCVFSDFADLRRVFAETAVAD
jgi:putative hydrolase of the HAD superfamily